MLAPLVPYAVDVLPPHAAATATPAATTSTATPVATTPVATTPAATPPAGSAPSAKPAKGEVLLGLGLAGGTSTWSGDPVGYYGLTIGLRLFRVVTPFAQARIGYGRIDQRLLTHLAFGVEGGGYIGERFFPRGFAAFVHQHEESMAAVAEAPFTTVLGIGPGIRHRAGAHVGVGFDIVMHRKPSYELTLGPEIAMSFLTYSSGPGWYGIAGIVGSGHFRLF
jgi:hypothetical protein